MAGHPRTWCIDDAQPRAQILAKIKIFEPAYCRSLEASDLIEGGAGDEHAPGGHRGHFAGAGQRPVVAIAIGREASHHRGGRIAKAGVAMPALRATPFIGVHEQRSDHGHLREPTVHDELL